MAKSQKAEIASWPRCPLPSGSKADGPIGSSTTASSVNTFSQAALSLAITASRDRRPASCAGCLVSVFGVLTLHSRRRLRGLVGADHPHRVVLRAAAVGVAQRLSRTRNLVVAAFAHHLDRRLREADQPRRADRVRGQHTAG